MKHVISKLQMLVTAIIMWQFISWLVPGYLFPPPWKVAKIIFGSPSLFLGDFYVTLKESVGGLFVALGLSIMMAFFFQLIPKIEKWVIPYAIVIKSVPIIAIAPLLLIWCGNGIASKIILAALICFFPLLIGFSDGMKSLPKELTYLGNVWSTKGYRVIFLIKFPYALPSLFSALKVAAPLAVVGAIVAEFSGANVGLGHATLVAAYHTDAIMLFANVLLISLLGMLVFSAILAIEIPYLRKMRVHRVDIAL